LKLDHIRCFVAAFEAGSFSAAAEALGTAQPSVSKQIAEFEAELGVRLFRRGYRGIVPTAKARLLYAHARRVLADIDGFERIVKAA